MAKVMVKWGTLKWSVDPKKIKSPTSMSYSLSWDSDKGKKDNSSFSLEYPVIKGYSPDPQKERELIAKKIGEKHRLYIGAKRLSSYPWRLTKADISDISITETGITYLQNISLSFEEVRNKKESKKK